MFLFDANNMFGDDKFIIFYIFRPVRYWCFSDENPEQKDVLRYSRAVIANNSVLSACWAEFRGILYASPPPR